MNLIRKFLAISLLATGLSYSIIDDNIDDPNDPQDRTDLPVRTFYIPGSREINFYFDFGRGEYMNFEYENIEDTKKSTIVHFLVSPYIEYYDQDHKNELLKEACSSNNLHVYIEPLIEKGANINMKKSNGISLLHSASSRCLVNVVESLLKAGMNPNIVDNEESTPLHKLASEHFLFLLGNIDLFKKTVCLLLEYEANPFLVDKNGKTPIDLITEKGFEDIAKIMENHKPVKSLRDYCLTYIRHNLAKFHERDIRRVFNDVKEEIIIGIDDID